MKNFKKLVLFFLLLLILFIGGGWFTSVVNAAPKIEIEFPSIIPVTLERLPIRIFIPHPLEFGFPRIPSDLKISFVGYRNQGIAIPLIVPNDLSDVAKISQFLNNPIQIETEVPIPSSIRKKGIYRIVIDVKCVYGPRYSLSYWYSYTANQSLEITSEKIHIVAGPEIIEKPTNVIGYFGTNHGTYKISTGYVDIVDVISENGKIIDKVKVIRSETEIKEIISSNNNFWKIETYSFNDSYTLLRLRKYAVFGKFYGYSFSQSLRYDWDKKGISYKFRVQVINENGTLVYEEPAALIGVAFEENDLTLEYIEKEKKELEAKYSFLLKQFPQAELKIEFEKGPGGNWRFLFSNQPYEWIKKKGIVVECTLPLSSEGKPMYLGLNRLEWPGFVWNPWQEFQLEVLSSN